MQRRRIGFESDGLALSGEAFVPDGARLCAVLLHGIPGSSRRDPSDAGYEGFAADLARRGFAAFFFDMRGVRDAPGDFSMAGWRRDLGAALDTLARDRVLGSLARVVVGSSAGGGVALAVSADRADVTAVATLAAPASYSFGALAGDAASLLGAFRNLGIVRDPGFPKDVDAWWTEIHDADPERHAGALSPRPLLIVHGDSDDVVPYPHAERLFSAAGAPKELARIPHGGHQLRRDPRAVDCIADWLAQLPSNSSGQ